MIANLLAFKPVYQLFGHNLRSELDEFELNILSNEPKLFVSVERRLDVRQRGHDFALVLSWNHATTAMSSSIQAKSAANMSASPAPISLISFALGLRFDALFDCFLTVGALPVAVALPPRIVDSIFLLLRVL